MVQEIECRQAHFYSLYSVVTLNIRSMSPKSNQIFKPSQRYKIWNLARIRLLVQDTGCRQAFFFYQNLKNSKCWCDLEKEVKIKNLITSFPLRIMFCASLVEINWLVQEIECRQEATPTPTGSAPNAICSPPPHTHTSVGGHNNLTQSYWNMIDGSPVIFNMKHMSSLISGPSI